MKDIVIHTLVVPEAFTIFLESCIYHKLLRCAIKFIFVVRKHYLARIIGVNFAKNLSVHK